MFTQALTTIRAWVDSVYSSALKKIQRESVDDLTPRQRIHAHFSIGDQLADAVVGGMGSWRFLIGQTVIVVAWIGANAAAWQLHWDVYPFILLNLVFSTQAAYASPLILMASNRTADKDKVRDDTEADEVAQLYQMNKTQLEQIVALQAQVAQLADLLQPAAKAH